MSTADLHLLAASLTVCCGHRSHCTQRNVCLARLETSYANKASCQRDTAPLRHTRVEVEGPALHTPPLTVHINCTTLQDPDDDEESGAGAVHQEEWMARVAVLLRADPVTSFNKLADLIGKRQQALAAAAAARQDPSELLEQLYWLVRMAAHALADSGVGEIPLPPEPVLLAVGDNSLTTAGAAIPSEQQQASAVRASAGAAAVERLARSLLELTAVCLQQAAAAVVSSRLMEGCTWAAARWADTYLFPEEDEPLPEALEAAFGDQNGLNILDMLVHVAKRCLTAFPGEIELHKQVGLPSRG